MESFGSVQTRIQLLHNRLEFIQALDPSPQAWEAELSIQSELAKALEREECIWKQKSRIRWLTTSDLNIKFFHLSTVIRRRRNNIESIRDERGTWLRDRATIGDHVVGYY